MSESLFVPLPTKGEIGILTAVILNSDGSGSVTTSKPSTPEIK